MKLKPEEQAEFLKFISLDEAETLEQAKEQFQEKFIPEKKLTETVGKLTGSIVNVARKIFTPFGVELTEEDFKGKKIEEVLKTSADQAVNFHTTKLTELQSLAEGKVDDTLLKKKDEEITTWKKKFEEAESLKTDLATQFDSFKNNVETEKKQGRINTTFSTALEAVKIDPSTDKYKLKGFRTEFDEKYLIDLEDNSVVVKDKKTGEKLKSSAKAGQFMSLEEILTKEATEAGIIQKNPHNGNRTGFNNNPTPVPIPEKTNTKGANPRFYGV